MRYQIKNLQHGLALAHNVFEVVALLQRPLELDVFLFGAVPSHRRPHVGQQFFVIPGLLDKVGRARLHRTNRVFHGAVSGNHDHGDHPINRPEVHQDVQPIAVRQGDVEQHEIECALADAAQSFLARRSGFHFIAFQFEQGA